MPLRLDIKRKLVQRSDRIKGVELHPTEPWILANLYSGNVYVWNHQTNTLVKSFEVTELPVRTAKWVARKQWIVCGSDDMFVRTYNYNTTELVKSFEAHTDYIRCISVHPTSPYLLTSSDDMLIKLWDWEKDWACTQVLKAIPIMWCRPYSTQKTQTPSLLPHSIGPSRFGLSDKIAPTSPWKDTKRVWTVLNISAVVTDRTLFLAPTISLLKFGTFRQNVACKHSMDMLTMFPRYVFTQSFL